MKALKKLTVCVLLAISFVLPSFFVQIETKGETAASGTGYTQASDVDYVKSGNYVANWGARDEDCVFLSSYAESFYTGNYVYETLSQQSGGTGTSDAPSSALYSSLQNLMSSKQTHETSYDETKNLFRYTDCIQSDYSKISSFYSGQMLSGTWGSGWNREHTWPNSKGDKAGNGENDIMMLRPASTSENSSRGNKAYGESSGYYDPNESNKLGQELRGDCARIVLYVYVRWGCTNTGSGYNPTDIFGTKGVIESLTLLLRWMQEDPVDTWEMGRNDAVQSITGTRNVFVDYPEYAWLLFGQSIPEGITTPSGMAKENSSGSSSDSSSSSSSSSSSFEDSSVNSSVDSSVDSIEVPCEALTLAFNDTANRTTQNDSVQIWEDNGVKLTNNKSGNSSNVGNYSNPARFYSGSEIIVECANMIKLVFTCNTAAYARTLASAIDAMGGVSLIVDGSDVIITFAQAVDSFKITSLSTGQVRVNSLTAYVPVNEQPPVDSSVEESSSIEDSSEESSSSLEESSSIEDSSEESSSSLEESSSIEDSSEESSSSVEESSSVEDSSEENSCEHEYGRWYVIKQPTETEEGEQHRFCGLCGALQVESIPVLLPESSIEESSSIEASSEGSSSSVEESSEAVKNSAVEESSTVENSSVTEETSIVESDSVAEESSAVVGCSSSLGASMGGVLLLLAACSFVYKTKKKE